MEQNIKKRQSVMIFFVSLLIWSFLFYKNDTHTHTHTCTHARTHAHAHARACTQTHIHAHTHTRTQIYIYAQHLVMNMDQITKHSKRETRTDRQAEKKTHTHDMNSNR